MGTRTRRKADFVLPSAEGDWGYPEDMLVKPSNNGNGSVNGNGGAPAHESDAVPGEVVSKAPDQGPDQEDAA